MISRAILGAKVLPHLFYLKERYGLKIVESHVHPYEVMGVAHYLDYTEMDQGDFRYHEFSRKKMKKVEPRLLRFLERMDFNRFFFKLFNAALRLFPGYLSHELKAAFERVGKSRIAEEMDRALIDEAVLLPVEPWVPTALVQSQFKDRRFHLLGSLDIHRLKIQDIQKTVKKYVEDFQIIGLKLHPNIQDFKPQPSHNPKEIEEKLKRIYELAEEENLYLLFHGGPSGYTRYPDEKYGDLSRSPIKGQLENFCDSNGRSELLGRYKIPIVIAHLGHFGLPKFNKALVRTIFDRYENVYFDTAGSPSGFIKTCIEIGGSERIILGSDALYFRMMHSIAAIYEAAHSAASGENPDQIMVNILGRNFQEKILRRGKNI